MFCQKCQMHLPEESKFCLHCGKQTATDEDVVRRRIIAVITVLGVCAAIFITVAALPPILKGLTQKPPADAAARFTPSTPVFSPTPTPTPYWQTKNYQIESHAVALDVGQMWWQPLFVKEEWRNARLVGRFTAQGGSRDDVYACVTDEDGLANLKNNLAHNVWYESGRVTVNTINARLPYGRSYFVLKNKYAWFTNRAITFDLKIEYERLVYP